MFDFSKFQTMAPVALQQLSKRRKPVVPMIPAPKSKPVNVQNPVEHPPMPVMGGTIQPMSMGYDR